MHRLELRGDLRLAMPPSENNRRARIYTITPRGRRRLEAEQRSCEAFALSMRRVLLALMLGVVGIFGGVAAAVSERLNEIAIRAGVAAWAARALEPFVFNPSASHA